MKNELTEHLSRPARRRLFGLVHARVAETVKGEIQSGRRRRRRGRPPVSEAVAAILGVSKETVKRWRRGDWQASDVNARVLLSKALEMDRDQTSRILTEDVEEHRRAVERFLSQG